MDGPTLAALREDLAATEATLQGTDALVLLLRHQALGAALRGEARLARRRLVDYQQAIYRQRRLRAALEGLREELDAFLRPR